MSPIHLTCCLGKLYLNCTFTFTQSTHVTSWSDSKVLRHFATKLARNSSHAFVHRSTAATLYGSGTLLHKSPPSQEKRLGDH